MAMIKWATFKKFLDKGYPFCEEILGSNRYYLCVNPKGVEYDCVMFYTETSNKSDYETNYQGNKEASLADTFSGQNAHLFDSEALASGVYEDSPILICDAPHKTLNIKNEHATNALNYKVWGSPDNSEWEEIIGETALAALTKISVTNNDYWKYIKISAEGSGGVATIDAFVQVGI